MTEATNTEIVETVEQWTITDDVDLPVSSMEGTNTDDVDRPVSVMDDGHGTTAPMSAPDRLPPAFAEYDRRGIPETNPFEEFMSNEDYVALDDTGAILLDDLRDLYNTYLQDRPPRSVRWSEDVYMTSLTKRQLHVSRPARSPSTAASTRIAMWSSGSRCRRCGGRAGRRGAAGELMLERISTTTTRRRA